MRLDDPLALLKAARREPRWWYYNRASRRDPDDPTWRSPWWPSFSGDEYGRKTIVLPIPFHGEWVFAFWTWKGEEDDASRLQTYTCEQEERLRPHAYEKTVLWMKELQYIDVKHELDEVDISWSMFLEGDVTEVVQCAFLSLGYNAIRLYPQDLGEDFSTVTVRVERKEQL